jgi:glycosyltransferase involved in cell wall biosynthesis
MKKPDVSVIIPTYNRARLIGKAVRSVLQQTYQDFEIIIVDDASTDNTDQIIKSCDDARIIYMKHKINRGASAARNTGIKNSRGKYIAFLDSDDEWLPQKLEKQIAVFDRSSNTVGAIYCFCYIENGLLGFTPSKKIWSDSKRGDVYNSLLKGWCPPSTSLFILSAKVIIESGLFDEDFPSFQDYDLWVRVSEKYDFDCAEEYLAVKHQHSDGQLTTDLRVRIKGLELFLDKWGDVIKKEAGERAYDNIRKRKYLSAIYGSAVFSLKKAALRNCNRLSKVRMFPLKDLIRVPLVLFGGAKFLHFLEYIWHRLIS